MRTLTFTFVLGLSTSFSIFAYPNLYHKEEGTADKNTRSIPDISYTFDTAFAQNFVNEFDFKKPSDYTYQDLSDAGVYLTQLGENHKALNVFNWLHEQHSEEYNIASNLGVAHQLNGNLDSAEHYLQKAFNLSSHTPPKGEWVQLKIIAAKRSIEKDPDWLLHNQVLALNWDALFYNNNSTKHYNKKQQDSLQIVRYTNYKNQFDTLWSIGNVMQAHIPYVSTPNLLVANIMKELGYYFAINLSIKDAFIAYKIALHYDPKNKLKVEQELAQLMPHFRKYEFDESIFETKFHPASSSIVLQNKQPVHENDVTKTSSKSVSMLFWQAGLAVLVLFLILGYSLFGMRKR
jgi:tetratricopeptide (TPR) repeat protein